MGSHEFLNQSLQGGLEKISYMSSNGLLGNCCKVPSEHVIGQNGGSTILLSLNYFLCSFLIFFLSIFFPSHFLSNFPRSKHSLKVPTIYKIQVNPSH